MIQIDGNVVFTTEPETKRLHRLAFDTDIYFTRGMLLTGETAEDFAEVSVEDIPSGDDEPLAEE